MQKLQEIYEPTNYRIPLIYAADKGKHVSYYTVRYMLKDKSNPDIHPTYFNSISPIIARRQAFIYAGNLIDVLKQYYKETSIESVVMVFVHYENDTTDPIFQRYVANGDYVFNDAILDGLNSEFKAYVYNHNRDSAKAMFFQYRTGTTKKSWAIDEDGIIEKQLRKINGYWFTVLDRAK